MDLMMLVPVSENDPENEPNVVHVCEVLPDGANLERVITGKGAIPRFRRWFRGHCMVSTKHPYTRTCLKSLAAINYERLRHMNSFYYMVHPFSRFRVVWESIMTVFTIIALTAVPVMVTFRSALAEENGWKYWIHFVVTIDIIFLCDIILWFQTGNYENHTKIIFLDPRTVACKYVKGFFAWDVLSALPLELLGLILEDEKSSFTYFNIFKILRLRTFIVYGRRLRYSFGIEFLTYKFIELAVIILLSLNWAACFEYYLPQFTNRFYHDEERKTWIQDPELRQNTVSQWYLLSVHRAAVAFVCAKQYQKVDAEEDVALNIILTTLGRVAIIYLLVQFLQILGTLRTTSKKYVKLVLQLHEYMRYKELPYEIQQRLLSYCDYCFKKSFEREKDILNQVSLHLREEIVLHNCGKMVKSVEFFQSLPPVVLARLAMSLKSEVFLTHDIIVKAGTPGDAMYFISAGTVAIYTSLGKEVCHLEDGAHFGEIALIMDNEHRIATVIAVETCELYILMRGDFQRAIEPYPKLLNRLQKQALERLEKTILLDGLYQTEGHQPTNVNISNIIKRNKRD